MHPISAKTAQPLSDNLSLSNSVIAKTSFSKIPRNLLPVIGSYVSKISDYRSIAKPFRDIPFHLLLQGRNGLVAGILKKISYDVSQLPPELKNASKSITSLNFEYSNLLNDEKLLAIITQFPNLKKLGLRGCNNITAKGFLALKACTHLVELDLGWTNADDTTVQAVSSLPNLQKLNLWMCESITPKGFLALKACTHLVELDLSRTKADDTTVEALKDLPNLQKLDLGMCKSITPKGFLALKASTHLVELYLRFTKADDTTVQAVSSLPNLQKLNLSWCKNITDQIKARLRAQYPRLEIID
jgi:hypothetical protein